jgi:predicted 3-demethylubiquinone-9 3-methyltransferase (glyoxalase superfamily)
VEAAQFYAGVFPDSTVDYVGQLRNTPSGDCDVVSFRLGGQPFQAISAGPLFRFNPSISFIVNFDPSRDSRARAQLDAAWAALSAEGQILMPLDVYPFSERYGWVQDRFGLSWQLILSDPAGEPRPFIVPALTFSGARCGQAEDAIAFWCMVFAGARMGRILRYPAGMAPNREGTVMFADFRLGDTWFAAMDSALDHGFDFNEAVSFMVLCRDQAEIDRYWEALSAVPEAEACGWCKDRFGVSWQIVPAELEALLRSSDQARVDRVTQAFLPMKKLDLATLQAAFATRSAPAA